MEAIYNFCLDEISLLFVLYYAIADNKNLEKKQQQQQH